MRRAFRRLGAQEGTRTPTTLRSLIPETSASTNSATWARTDHGSAPAAAVPAPGRDAEHAEPRGREPSGAQRRMVREHAETRRRGRRREKDRGERDAERA